MYKCENANKETYNRRKDEHQTKTLSGIQDDLSGASADQEELDRGWAVKEGGRGDEISNPSYLLLDFLPFLCDFDFFRLRRRAPLSERAGLPSGASRRELPCSPGGRRPERPSS